MSSLTIVLGNILTRKIAYSRLVAEVEERSGSTMIVSGRTVALKLLHTTASSQFKAKQVEISRVVLTDNIRRC